METDRVKTMVDIIRSIITIHTVKINMNIKKITQQSMIKQILLKENKCHIMRFGYGKGLDISPFFAIYRIYSFIVYGYRA